MYRTTTITKIHIAEIITTIKIIKINKYGAGTSVAIVLGDAVTTFVKNTWK
jgi:hypothetical protein